ncbi:MAG: hypothetical protein LBI01_04110 [Elusimicrobium sp.]|jgi:hypothetical protein|nr:hypothetical protein [Elusimicrobium sp.]
MQKTFLLLCMTALLSACAATSAAPSCNLYVIALMKQKNIYLPQANANGLDNYLKDSKDWIKVPRINGKLNHKAAYLAANTGRVALATYNTHSGRSGHIAEVYGKKKMEWSMGFNALVPYVNSTVNGRKPGVSLLSQQFKPSKESRMNYYIYDKK